MATDEQGIRSTQSGAPGSDIQSAGVAGADSAGMSASAFAEVGGAAERGEISAVTIARMMGLATVTETKLVESKVDLLAAKINTLQVKLEKALSLLGNVATGADLERVDVQVGALRTLIREVMAGVEADKAPAVEEQKKQPGTRIQSNS